MMMMKHLSRIEPRRLPLIAGGAAVLVCAALFVYLVLPQYRLWSAADAERDSLAQSIEATRSVAVEYQRVSAEVETLERGLRGDAESVPEQALEALVIGRLQTLSWRRGVELVSVQPMPAGAVGTIRETAFRLELAGDYADLRAWLADLGRELEFVTVRELRLAPLDGESANPRLQAGLTLAAYRSTT